MLKEMWKTIGRALSYRETVIEKEVIREVEKKEKQIAGFFAESNRKLVSETVASKKLLESNHGWVYRNNDVIAKEVATIEFELYSTKIVGEEVVFTPILQHPLLDALDRFNDFTDASSGFYLTQSHKKLAGDAFWYVDRNGLDIKGIYLLPPDKVTIKPGKAQGGRPIIEAYEYKDSIDGKPVKEVYKPEEIVQFKIPNPNNIFRGKSVVEAAAEAIDTDTYAIEANKSMFSRGLINNFILSTEKSLTPDQLKQLRAELRSNYAGVSNASKTLILSGGLKPETISMTSKDAEFIAQQEWLRDKIMSLFGNTKAVLGITDDVNRANAEEAVMHWKRTTVKAEMKSITDTINEFLVPLYGENLILTFKDPVPEDMDKKIEKITKLKNADLISINEAREELGYAPIDGGDEMGFQRTERQSRNNPQVIPKSLYNVDYVRMLRRYKIYQRIEKIKELKKAALPVAKRIVESKRKTEPQEHITFNNDQVWDFHNKQIRLVEAYEKIFEDKLIKFIDNLVEKAVGEIPNEVVKMQHKQLIDEEAAITQAVLDFKPLLAGVASIAGQDALEFIKDDSPYITTNINLIIEKHVKKFATSMVETDRDKLIDIIAEGVANGDSVPKIRKRITDEFSQYSRMQAERITRTEVIRTSNLATIDAWKQSGLVRAKQWLTAKDSRVCPYCAPMNGKIVDIDKNYFSTKDEWFGDSDTPLTFEYGAVKGGNLHVNCRCTLLPVLIKESSIIGEPRDNKELHSRIAELESLVDKRTKAFKKIKAENADDKLYIKALEKHLGVYDE